MEQENKPDYLKHFDNIFGTNAKKKINLDNLPLLNYLYEQFSDELFTPTKEYEKLKEKENQISKQLESTFTEQQQELFIKQWELQNDMHTEIEHQLFMFGYIVAKTLDVEPKEAIENK